MDNKEVLLFAGNNYYPSGGAKDFIGRFASAELATAHVYREYKKDGMCSGFDWYQIVDPISLQVTLSASVDYNEDSQIIYLERLRDFAGIKEGK